MRVTNLVIQILLVFILGVFAQSVSAGNCDNPRYAAKNPLECDDPGTDPPGEQKTLEVTVFFGDESVNGDPEDCVNSADCVSTTFTVEGSVTCSSQVCDFEGEVTPETQKVFNIPPSIFNLLAMTEIRGTRIEPEQCFDIDNGVPSDGSLEHQYTGPGSTKAEYEYQDDSGELQELTYAFWLRSPVVAGPDQKWYAKAYAVSTDMENVPQRYIFHFGGNCDLRPVGSDKCPSLSGGDFSGAFEEGWGGGIFGSNTNRRGEPQTCRCTVSSKPSCPSNVDMGSLPRPASRIEIADITH